MASLVADYTDSESGEETEVKIKTEIEEITVKQESSEPSVNFFDSAEYESDEDKKEVDVKTEIKVEKLPNLLQTEKLPSIIEAAKARLGTSVFANPFEEAEQAKNQILEKHVKLTEAAPRKPAHQPMCWKFKKGKCHLGKNCRFFHDPESRTIPDSPTIPDDTFDASAQSVYHPTAFSDCHTRTFEEEDDDNYLATARKKKRYGVSDHLMPPKKALESLQRQREKERPWTLESSQLDY